MKENLEIGEIYHGYIKLSNDIFYSIKKIDGFMIVGKRINSESYFKVCCTLDNSREIDIFKDFKNYEDAQRFIFNIIEKKNKEEKND